MARLCRGVTPLQVISQDVEPEPLAALYVTCALRTGGGDELALPTVDVGGNVDLVAFS